MYAYFQQKDFFHPAYSLKLIQCIRIYFIYLMWNVVYILNQTGKRCSPTAKGGLEIVLKAVFKIDDA